MIRGLLLLLPLCAICVQQSYPDKGQPDGGLPLADEQLDELEARSSVLRSVAEQMLTPDRGGPRGETAAMRAAQSRLRGSGAIRGGLHKTGAGLNQGHVAAMEDYTVDPALHDAGCQGALPLECDGAYRFRTISGVCNNLAYPMWGSSSSKLARFVPAVYADGKGLPRGSYQPTICDRKPRGGGGESCCTRCFTDPKASLPSARLVSRHFHATISVADRGITHMLAQFGQLLDHDVALSPESETEESCCGPAGAHLDECLPIVIPDGDPVYAHRCMEFKRSTVFCAARYAVYEQMNAITAFVDASFLYGSTPEDSLLLREEQGGRLRVFKTESDKTLLPKIKDDATAGDVRAREQPGLTTMHALFLREHNRIADGLAELHPEWDDEELYQQTRRIVGAETQNIVFGEWLPIVLGDASFYEHRLDPDHQRDYYDPTLDPSIRNSFATAVFRFGHTLIQGLFELFAVGSSMRRTADFRLRDNFFKMDVYFERMEEILAGLFKQNAQRFDMFVTADLRDFLFENMHEFGEDLIARNIQRGRDHGLPGYNDFRDFCGLERACNFSHPPAEIPAGPWQKLANFYDSPSDVDFFTAGLLEAPFAGGLVGRTFNCIMARQFHALKFGDRFFFTLQDEAEEENVVSSREEEGGPLRFSPEQVRHLRRRGLSDLVCDNSDLAQVRDNAFRADSPYLDCGGHDALDLGLF